MPHLLVTGAAGFIGSHFVDYWLHEHGGDTVTILDSLDTAGVLDNVARNQDAYGERCRFVKADITDYPSVDRIFRSNAFDIVINFAAISSQDRALETPHDCQRINLGGVMILFDCARMHHVRRFHQISTCEVYGALRRDEQPFTEESPLRPISPYNQYKAQADTYLLDNCTSTDMTVTISRSCNNYGPYQYLEKLIPYAVTNLLTDEKLVLHARGGNVREWLHVADHVRALDIILQKGEHGQVYNIGTGEQASADEITDAILYTLGRTKHEWKEYGPDRQLNDAAYLLNSDKLKQLGWHPAIRLRDEAGLQQTVQWYLRHREWWSRLKLQQLSERRQQQKKPQDWTIEPTHVLHHDARRTIYGISLNNDKIDEDYTSAADVEVIEIGASAEQPVVLGEHYHDSAEVLYVIDGKIHSCLLEDIQTGHQTTLKHITQHTKLYIPPLVAHRLRIVEPTRLLYINHELHRRDKTNKAYKFKQLKIDT